MADELIQEALRSQTCATGVDLPATLLRRRDLTSSDKIVLALLWQINRTKIDPEIEWPAREEIAAVAGLPMRTWQLVISRLKAKGWLIVSGRGKRFSYSFPIPHPQPEEAAA